MGGSMEEEKLGLFETKKAKNGEMYRAFAGTVLMGIGWIWAYRATQIPRAGEDGRWGFFGLFTAELWFSFYCLLGLAFRWNRIYRFPFPHRYEKEVPRVDIFVCTASPAIEPPIMVINTVLSVMAYDYPPEKLSVYLSDDAGANITLYALLEACSFSNHWLPYCRKFHVQPTCPAAHFTSPPPPPRSKDATQADHFAALKKLYEEMEDRIKTTIKLGRIPEELRSKQQGFSQWDRFSSHSKEDHDTILQILIDGRDPESVDVEGSRMPTLVYLAREKRPHHPHNFKAGALNALIRVSANISNAPIILTIDCDMYSNNSNSLRQALCFFMDEEKGHDVAFVQFPQNFENLTKNDLYSSCLRVISHVDFHGLDGVGGPLYIGSGCFHRRDALCGLKPPKEQKAGWKKVESVVNVDETASLLEERLKPLASCGYEKNTQWGNEMGLKYGCAVEDVITGLSIHSRGWRSVYCNPERAAFLGIAPMTLSQALVQQKRWSEGDLQILLSGYSPLWYGGGKISPLLRMGYCAYCLWAPNCFATLYYSLIPSLYLLKGIPLFPQISSPWILPFAYIIISRIVWTFLEFRWAGGTTLGWWNDQRMWVYKRTSSYLFACIDTGLKLLGFSNSAFEITAKVADGEVSQRYEEEMMEFGDSSPMFTILSTVALVNLFCLVGVIKEMVLGGRMAILETMLVQTLLCLLLVLLNLPIYQGLFLRRDKGKMPMSVTVLSVGLALLFCACFAVV